MFFNELLIGTQVEQYGKKWVIVGVLKEGYYLAMEYEAKLPAPVQVIYHSFKGAE